jgi:hypothetical protein
MDQYTLYMNQSGGGHIGPVYSARFSVQTENGVGSFFWELLHFVKPLL